MEMKEAWKLRAGWLNGMSRPGVFLNLSEFSIGTDDILESLNLEWERFAGVLKSAINQKLKNPKSKIEVSFRKERVKILSQSYCTFDMSSLLQLCIGGKDFKKFKNHKIVKKMKETILLHIHSTERMKEIFTLRGYSGVIYKDTIGLERNALGKLT